MYWEYKTHLKLTIKVVGGFRIIQSPNVNFGITSHEKKKVGSASPLANWHIKIKYDGRNLFLSKKQFVQLCIN